VFYIGSIVAVAAREWAVTMKSWRMALLAAAGPILTFVLFAVALAKTIGQVTYEGTEVAYLAFILPGILAMNGIAAGQHAGVPVYMDRMTGELEALFALPRPRVCLILGKAVILSARAVVQSGLILLLASFILRSQLGPSATGVVVALVGVMLLGMGFTFAFIALASVTRQEAFNFVSNLIYAPILFLSPLYYPLDRLPHVLQLVARVNPLTYGVNLVRSSLLRGGTSLLDLGVVLAFVSVSFILSSLGFKRLLK